MTLLALSDPITKGDVGMFLLFAVIGIVVLAILWAILSGIAKGYRH